MSSFEDHLADEERPVSELRNIGPKVATALASIGIHTAGELRAMGALEAYRRMSDAAQHPLPRRPYLHGIEAALLGLPLSGLPWRRRMKLSGEALGLPETGPAVDIRPRVVVRSRGGRRTTRRRR